MRTVRFWASILSTILLLGLCALLAGPSFELPAGGPRMGIGAGALPQFVVVATAILAVITLLGDIAAWRRPPASPIAGETRDAEDTDPRRVVILGGFVLVLLAAYIGAWPYLGFIPPTIGFIAALSLVLLPRAEWTAMRMASIALMAILFTLGVWALFVHVLMVPLR